MSNSLDPKCLQRLPAEDTTVKPVLSSHKKIDKTKVLETKGSLMKVKGTTECSLGEFRNNFHLHKVIISLENLVFFSFLSGCLRQVLL